MNRSTGVFILVIEAYKTDTHHCKEYRDRGEGSESNKKAVNHI
jgi:hypothetical protein